MKKRDKQKEPSLLRKVIEVYYQDALQKKAERALQKLEWSADFLTSIVTKTAKSLGQEVSIELVNKRGERMIISSQYLAPPSASQAEDSIFNHLDDDAAVERFIATHAKR
jgi:hypothetical protein